MWRRGALSLRRVGSSILEHRSNLLLGQQQNAGSSLPGGALRAFNNSRGGSSSSNGPNPQHARLATAATPQQQSEPSTSTSAPAEPPHIAAIRKKDEEYLKETARQGNLHMLLQDYNMMRQLGIPSIKLRRLMQDTRYHGVTGLPLVKELLYTDPAFEFPSLENSNEGGAASTPSAGAGAGAVNGQAKQQSPQTTTANESRFPWQRPGNAAPGSPSSPRAPPPAQQRTAPAAQSAAPTPQAASQPPLASNGASDGAAVAAQEDDAMPTSSRVSIRDVLNQQKIFLPSYAPGEYRTSKCPKCRGGSKNEPCFGVTIDPESKSAVFNCFRANCGFSGACHVDKPNAAVNSSGFFVSTTVRKRKEEPPVRPKVNLEPLTEEMIEYFAARGISEATLKRNRVSSEVVYDPMLKEKSRVIAFPYYRDGVLINVKYRTLDKRFWQCKGAEKVLYGLDDIASQAEVIIVEGEMDKLALEEAGVRNVVSVPDGAPARVKDGDLPPESEDTKYSYLWNCRAWLDQAVRVVIATDNDAPGDALAEELARRLGRERCWRVRWPITMRDHEFAARAAQLPIPVAADTSLAAPSAAEGLSDSTAATTAPELVDDEGSSTNTDANDASKESSSSVLDQRWYRKDANEVLLRDGDALLRAFLETAEPLPIRGLLRFHEYYDDVIKHYFLELRDGQGVGTGWPSLDQFYKVVPGELTIVTGVPNSGKSEWIDALLSNLSEMHGWTFALCSMEKRATDHARALAEKYVGKPFFDLPYARGIPRMSHEELDAAMDWVDDRFHLIRYEDDQLPSVDWVLEVAKAAVYRYGIRGLVIDPYNELDHQRPASMNETEYVSQMLTKVKRFAQTAGVHVWFVAHPRQLREWKGQAPNLYDISGSAHFINKADNGIVVHRNRDPNAPNSPQVQILVRKVRNKAAGTIGDCVLEYERVNGRYLDMEYDGNALPKTSQRVNWQQLMQQQKGREERVQPQPNGAFVHRDGSINREPESESFF